MSAPHINALQDVLRKIIRQVLDWYEPRFRRITMSHDTSGNPAELVGQNGTICYRKAGGSCVEIGTGGGSSYWDTDTIDGNAAVIPKLSRHVILEDCWLENQGASVNSDITFWAVYGGGGGAHPHIIVE